MVAAAVDQERQQDIVGGTLGQSNGAYRYADFGQWWRASLDAYAAAGVVPTYVSIQNEPDFLPTGSNPWSSCLIDATEDLTQHAGYGPALDAVAGAIGDLPSKPTLSDPRSRASAARPSRAICKR